MGGDDLIQKEQRGTVAVLRMARAPSNALSSAFCTKVQRQLDIALTDPAITGVVLASALPVFSAGSDVADVLYPQKGGRAALGHLGRSVAAARKPVVAAIGGACLSTGLDLALAVQARVASARASFGFPDVRLGLLPAGGGGYRLTRLIGARPALDMLLTGAAKPAEEALELGMIDRLCAQGGEVDEAVRLVQAMVQGTAGLSKREYVAHLREDMAAIAKARTGLPPQMGHWIAHHRIVDMVEAALLLGEDAALNQEYSVFEEVQHGPIARALCYAFVTRQRARQHSPNDAHLAIEPVLQQVMADVLDMFVSAGTARSDTAAALASFGIGVKAGAALPDCPQGAEDVIPALLAAWANAGARLLREGGALRAASVDYAALMAGLCPNWRGGPMFLADQRGALVLRAELRRRAKAQTEARFRALFTPDPLWDELVAQSLRFDEVEIDRAPS